MTTFTHTTGAAFNDALAQRLSDTGKVYWSDDELTGLRTEALYTWQALTSFSRARGEFPLAAGEPFYDLPTELPDQLSYTLTDQDLISAIQYHLLEPKSPAAWTGSEMWTLADLTAALQRQRNQLLADTACRITRLTGTAVTAGISRIPLPDATIDIRRAAYIDPDGGIIALRRSDTMTRGTVGAAGLVGKPRAYGFLSDHQLQINLLPVPIDDGELDLLLIQTGAAFDPAAGSTLLGIPDNWAWVLKWATLADLLSQDGPGRDAQRAAYCRDRVDKAIEIMRTSPTVVGAEINGVPVVPPPLASLDCKPNWQSTLGAPRIPVLASTNLLAVYPVPDNNAASITLDFVCNAPIPGATDFVQLGREQLDAVIGYAEHLAFFKQGGSDFYFTSSLLTGFLAAASVFNERAAAAAPYKQTADRESSAEQTVRPARWRRERDVAVQ